MPRLILPAFTYAGGTTPPAGGGGTTPVAGDPPADGTLPSIGNPIFAIDCSHSPTSVQPTATQTSNAGASLSYGGYKIPYLVDTTGQGHHFAMAYSANQPATANSPINGIVPIHFDSSQSQCFYPLNNSWPGLMRTGNPVLFIVASGVAFNLSQSCSVLSCSDRSGNGLEIQITGSGANYQPYAGRRTPTLVGTGDPGIDAYHNIASIVVWYDSVAGTLNIMSQNDTQPYSVATTAAMPNTTWTEFNIGCRNAGSGTGSDTAFFGGFVYEARAWNPATPIDAGYAKALATYGAQKY